MRWHTYITRNFAVLACTVTMFSAWAGPNGKPFITLDNQIVEVQGEVSSLQDQMDVLIGRVESIEAKVEANGSAVVSLMATTATLELLVDQNLTDVAAIQAYIQGLQAEISNVTAQIASATGDISALQNQLIDAETLLGQLQAALLAVDQDLISLETSLQDQIDNNAALISALQQEIGAINDVLAFQQNLAAGNCPDGSAVQDIGADGSYVCAGSASGIGGLQSTYLINIETLQPNGHTSSYVYCPTGWTATGAGFLAQWDVRVLGSYAQIDWGFFSARNMAAYSVPVFNILTCTRPVQ